MLRARATVVAAVAVMKRRRRTGASFVGAGDRGGAGRLALFLPLGMKPSACAGRSKSCSRA
ncbi:hypothetical protein ACFQ2K_02785 [Streptomyces sanglieri]|uniref:Uncharacterized protein n=1 Tax=Streptomyces sanglieri TaxID=193460 RepID=A0ABW2WKH6_9ACTN